MTRDAAIRRARSYSKRHNCTVKVQHVVKGRGKGLYETEVESYPMSWWLNTEVETIATYKAGKRT